MKTMHVTACLAVALCFIIIPVACKKSSNSVIHIEGFDIVDGSGNSMGHNGPTDNDWTFNNNLSDQELALFNFSNTTSVISSSEATISGGRVNVYPNPCTNQQAYYINVSDFALLKAVVVNDQLQVLEKTAVLLQKGPNTLVMPFYDTATFVNKASLRLYYSFSAQGKPNYKTGYGDIKICRNASSLSNCFE